MLGCEGRGSTPYWCHDPDRSEDDRRGKGLSLFRMDNVGLEKKGQLVQEIRYSGEHAGGSERGVQPLVLLMVF